MNLNLIHSIAVLIDQAQTEDRFSSNKWLYILCSLQMLIQFFSKGEIIEYNIQDYEERKWLKTMFSWNI